MCILEIMSNYTDEQKITALLEETVRNKILGFKIHTSKFGGTYVKNVLTAGGYTTCVRDFGPQGDSGGMYLDSFFQQNNLLQRLLRVINFSEKSKIPLRFEIIEPITREEADDEV